MEPCTSDRSFFGFDEATYAEVDDARPAAAPAEAPYVEPRAAATASAEATYNEVAESANNDVDVSAGASAPPDVHYATARPTGVHAVTIDMDSNGSWC